MGFLNKMTRAVFSFWHRWSLPVTIAESRADRDRPRRRPDDSRATIALMSGVFVPRYDENNPEPLTDVECGRIRVVSADLAARLAKLQKRMPPDTWRAYASRAIGDLIVAEKNRLPSKR